MYSVDLEDVITHRESLNGTNPQTKSVVSNVKCVGADLRNYATVETKLIEQNFSFHIRTLVISECVMCYLNPEASNNLLRSLSEKLCAGAVLVSYDPILKKSGDEAGFSRFMLRKFEERGKNI